MHLLIEQKGEKLAILEMRSHFAWYLKGIEGSKEIKDKIFKTKDEEEIKNILYDFKKLISKN